MNYYIIVNHRAHFVLNKHFEQTICVNVLYPKSINLCMFKEQLSHYEGDNCKKIEMQDIPFNLAYEKSGFRFTTILEISWKI